MKEKIFEILHNRKRMPREHFSDIEGRVEELVNQEVEKRIKDRMGHEGENMDEGKEYARKINLEHGHDYNSAYCGFRNGYKWLRSRLTKEDE